jgi:hypothetical protein
MVCQPKEEGGLGVLNLQTHNEALLLKHFHKFYNKIDILWVQLIWERHYTNGKLPNHTRKGSFWWRDILSLLDSYKGISSPLIQSGSTVLLWYDLINGQICQHVFPELFSFAKHKSLTVQQAKNTVPLTDLPFASLCYRL